MTQNIFDLPVVGTIHFFNHLLAVRDSRWYNYRRGFNLWEVFFFYLKLPSSIFDLRLFDENDLATALGLHVHKAPEWMPPWCSEEDMFNHIRQLQNIFYFCCLCHNMFRPIHLFMSVALILHTGYYWTHFDRMYNSIGMTSVEYRR